ncbi:MAG: precorrin-6Y C5,15-methyltransferase subunit CbiT [Cyanobacteria bacterium J06639_1]
MSEPLWPYCTPGIPDDAFDRIPGIPLSQREMRVLMISQLRLTPASCVWDIGAGTGTIAVEAALLCPQGTVYAIERDEEVVELIQRNSEKFGATNVRVIQGTAPDCLLEIPQAPDRICFEGGAPIGAIVEQCWSLLKSQGRLISTASSLDALYSLSESYAKVQARQVEIVQSAINRLETRGIRQTLAALDPIFILSGAKLD